MGAFGFLNGPSVAAKGTPNAGLHDQRAALKWVQDHIGLVGGDKNQVTAMGESAGAGSIMHHLVAEGGTLNPMFKRAIMQSPAFEPLYDNGRLEKQFQVYALEAGCPGQDLTCLRAASSEALQRANKGTILDSPYGTFGYGPGVDGTFIRDLPSMELAKGIESPALELHHVRS